MKDTDVWLVSTYKWTPKPSKFHINNALNTILFRRRKWNAIECIDDLTRDDISSNSIESFLKHCSHQVYTLKNSGNILSLFLFTHMPIAIYLGYEIWKSKEVELYHQLRAKKRNKWKWKNNLLGRFKKSDWKYLITKEITPEIKDIVLDFDISFPVSGMDIVWENVSIYRVELKSMKGKDRREFLEYEYQIGEFRKIATKAFLEIENTVWKWCKIHLFTNVPNPFAFIIGQCIHINWPEVWVYNENKERSKYEVMLKINEK